jgi:hypothetical protein
LAERTIPYRVSLLAPFLKEIGGYVIEFGYARIESIVSACQLTMLFF